MSDNNLGETLRKSKERIKLEVSKHFLHRAAPRGQHVWFENEFLGQPSFCNICEEPVFRGLQCEVCACVTHNKCMKMADRREICKIPFVRKPVVRQWSKHKSKGMQSSSKAAADNNNLRHVWKKGNLPLLSTCFLCLKSCGNAPGLCDYRCIWCQRTVHQECLTQRLTQQQICDFGPLKRNIVPPNAVTYNEKGLKQLNNVNKWTIMKEKCFDHPLLVFVNPRSGGNDGNMLLKWFYAHLNPIQVTDLSMESPVPLLTAFKNVSNARVLVCGGDGTVGWVLEAISLLKLAHAFPIAVIPLGTGNDFARALGWGGGYVRENVQELIRLVDNAKISTFDRWKVSISDTPSLLNFGQTRKRDFYVNNYFSIGIDAEVTLSFHNQREMYPFLFRSRTLNKFWYALFGGKKILKAKSRQLDKFLEVWLDNQKLDLPPLEALVLLNINSYSAGATPWYYKERGVVSKILQKVIFGREIVFDKENTSPSCINDGKFELIGIGSSFHVSQLVVGICDAMQLGQGKNLKVVMKNGSFPVQVDGEPWMQKPCKIDVEHAGQANVLIKKPIISIIDENEE